MSNTKLTPEEAVDRIKVQKGIYFLHRGYEKRMSTISQQIRAVSLIGSLLERGDPETGEKISPKEDAIAVIGGGIAGITAASIAAWRGCRKVHIFEKQNKFASAFENSERQIQPRLYEWTDTDWSIKQASIPILDWKEDTAKKVTETIRKQWQYWMDYFGREEDTKEATETIKKQLDYWIKHFGSKELKDQWLAERLADQRLADQRLYVYTNHEFSNCEMDDAMGLYNITFKHLMSGGIFEEKILRNFRWIILATGFGQIRKPERISENYLKQNPYIYDYWSFNCETFTKSKSEEKTTRIAIAGDNDSGLIEAIELSTLFNDEDSSETENLTQANLHKLLKKIDEKERDFRETMQEKFAEYTEIFRKKANEINRQYDFGEDEKKRSEFRKKMSLAEYEFYQKVMEIDFDIKDYVEKNKKFKIVILTRQTVLKDGKLEPYIKPHAFPLNLFLITRLIKAKFVEIKYCPDAEWIHANDENTKFYVPTDKAISKFDKYDLVLFRLGPEKNKTLIKFEDALLKRLREKNIAYNKDAPLEIARTEVLEKPADKEWILLSDLFDSFTQRTVFEELKKEKENIEEAEKELVRLYKQRLLIETKRRHKIAFFDSQFLDGCFFVRWLSEEISDQDKQDFKDKLIFRVRGTENKLKVENQKEALEYTWNNNFSIIKNSTDIKAFEYSYFSDDKCRDIINNLELPKWLLNSTEKGEISMKNLPDLVEKLYLENEESGYDASTFTLLKSEWKTFTEKQEKLIKNLQEGKFQIDIFIPGSDDYPFNLPSAYEDPALYSIGIEDWEEKKDIALEIMGNMFEEEYKNRSDIWKKINRELTRGTKDEIGEETRKSQRIRNFYNRAYNRNLARQHGGNIFETVNVNETCIGKKGDSFAKYTPRDGKNWNYDKSEMEFSDLEDKPPTTEAIENQHLLEIDFGNALEFDEELDTDLGKRALAVLRGANREIKRTPIEESFQVGTQIPIIIDEEKITQNGKEIILSRVEYSYNIPDNGAD